MHTLETIAIELLANTTGGQQAAAPATTQPAAQPGADQPRMLPVYGAGDAKAVYCNLGHNPSKCSTIPPGGLLYIPSGPYEGYAG